MKPLIVLLLFCFTVSLKAQSVKGNWYGVGHIQREGNSENYLSELILKYDGNNVKGEFNYYFRDSLFQNKITCSFNKKTRLLVIKKFPIIYYRSQSTKKAVMCDVNGIFELRVAKTGSVLNGSITSSSQNDFLMPVINYRMMKDKDYEKLNRSALTILSIDSLIAVNSNKIKIESNVKRTAITIDSVIAKKIEPIPATILTEKAFNERKKDYAKVFEVDNSKIRLEVYDNGSIDYDSVSLLLNGKLILPKTMLTHHSVKITIDLDENLEYNELGIFAENLGLIPHNTAELIIRDGKKNYELIWNSDLNTNAIVQLKTKKEKKKD